MDYAASDIVYTNLFTSVHGNYLAPSIRAAGLGVTVADAMPVIKQYADIITAAKGGDGAVREFCDWLMQTQGTLQGVLEPYLQS